MLLLRRPNDALIKATIEDQRHADLTYAHVGWTERSATPDGFAANHWKAVIGNGDAAFQRAKEAILDYQMLNIGWLQRVGLVDPVAVNSHVCTLARLLGVYSLNVARIVYVDDQSDHRFGFGYGTLTEYPLAGEERFTVELDPATKDVTFEIFSFSRPNSVPMSVAFPILRRAQRRFCVDASKAMRAYCKS